MLQWKGQHRPVWCFNYHKASFESGDRSSLKLLTPPSYRENRQTDLVKRAETLTEDAQRGISMLQFLETLGFLLGKGFVFPRRRMCLTYGSGWNIFSEDQMRKSDRVVWKFQAMNSCSWRGKLYAISGRSSFEPDAKRFIFNVAWDSWVAFTPLHRVLLIFLLPVRQRFSIKWH